MPRAARPWTDDKMKAVVGGLLRWGVIVSSVVVLIGGMEFLLHYGLQHPDYRVFHGEPTDLRYVRGIMTDALTLSSRGLIQLGLLLLIATPVARVAFSVYAFLRQRDILYTVVTGIVLGLLLFSLSGGHLP